MQLSASPDEARPYYIAVFACITCLVGIALGTLCGGALLEAWEGMGWFTGGLDRVKALVILSTVLRVLVAVCLVPPLENDRDETMGICCQISPAAYCAGSPGPEQDSGAQYSETCIIRLCFYTCFE